LNAANWSTDGSKFKTNSNPPTFAPPAIARLTLSATFGLPVEEGGSIQTVRPVLPAQTGTGVFVGVGVGQTPPGQGVGVGVGVDVGPLVRVAEPSTATAGIVFPRGSERLGSKSSKVVPVAGGLGVKRTVESVPLPVAPGCVPVVGQAKRNVVFVGAPTTGWSSGARHDTILAVLPRNEPVSPPSTASKNVISVLSNVRMTSYAPRFVTFSIATLATRN
jgi:hypothetical protein